MKIRLPEALIVDVDNTLFDWVGVWYAAFSALLNTLSAAAIATSPNSADTAEVRRALTARFRALHRRHGSTEYPFALGELSSIDDEQSLTAFVPEPLPEAMLREAAARHRAAAEAALTTYPLVRETLGWFRTHGTTIVAVTETRADVSGPRLRQLGLDGLVDVLYAPEPWEPRSIDACLVLWPHGLPQLDSTIARPLIGRVKPQPALLRVILADLDVHTDEALYVGDHLDKDVAMARAARVPAVWARYGTVRVPHEVALLHEVCHWPVDASVPASRGDEEPRPLIIDSFAELPARYSDEAWLDVRNEPRAKATDPDVDSGHARGDRHRAAGRGGS